MVNALAEEMRDEIAMEEFVHAEGANLRYQMLAAHLASFIGLALLICSTPDPKQRAEVSGCCAPL